MAIFNEYRFFIGNLYNLTAMSFEEKQILKLSKQVLLQQTQLVAKDQQYKRQRGVLLQKIQFLQLELTEYQQKQMKNRQLNQSIMMSYRQNESYREQHNQQQISNIGNKHQQEIKKIKQKHADIKNHLEEQLNTVKTQNDKLKIDAERTALQFQKKIAEVKREYDEKLSKQEYDLNFINQHKLDLMNERMTQTEKMNNFYKQQLQMRKCRNNQSDQSEGGLQYEQNNDQLYPPDRRDQRINKVPQLKREALSTLNLRINRALTQLNPNKLKLEERIRQIKTKHY